MKKAIFILLGSAVGFALGWTIVSQRSAEALLRERALWEKEKSALQAELDQAKVQGQETTPSVIERKKVVRVQEEIDPRDIIQRLRKIKISSGAGQTKNARLAIQQFETLIALGPSALPAIREFLLSNEEIDYDSSLTPRGSRDGRISTEFALPPSLRFGLFDVVRQIGGSDAEKLLVEILGMTGRGAEIAYLARVLQDIAPNKYRELSIQAARDLLTRPVATVGAGLDKYDREYLYGVLALYGDASFAGEAQTQLVRADGLIDRGALKYLQQTLGAQALPAIEQAYQDPNIDPSKKEPLVRYALTFAGIDAQATAFWHKSITDPTFPLDDRRELIEDLNQDGIESESKPTVRDAYLIAKRLQLISTHYNEVDDPRIKDAWREAGNDLMHMGQKFLSLPTSSSYVLGQDLTELEKMLLQASQPPR